MFVSRQWFGCAVLISASAEGGPLFVVSLCGLAHQDRSTVHVLIAHLVSSRLRLSLQLC
jgi:hypothetical protein